jgi:hypothetical protein
MLNGELEANLYIPSFGHEPGATKVPHEWKCICFDPTGHYIMSTQDKVCLQLTVDRRRQTSAVLRDQYLRKW